MFYDWLTIFQDHKEDLPYLGDTAEIVIDVETGEQLTTRQPAFKHDGSYSTSLSIRISGRRLTVKGNPSRINRLDNLFGYSNLDDCVKVYNQILLGLKLPPFTKCTKSWYMTGQDGKKAHSVSDGATIQELHITSNKSVGKGNELDYLKSGISTQRYRNSIPRLHSNGTTVDWLSVKGNASLIYPSVYIKGHELKLHQIDKIKRLHGTDSSEYKYIIDVYNFCNDNGVVRFEQKLKSRFLRKENLQFWGLSDYTKLKQLHKDFLNIDKTVQVSAMTYQSIAEVLLEEGVCKSVQASNATANYFFMWLHGERFDLAKSQVKVHRARLRKINIDIAEACDITKHSPVRVKEVRDIEVQELASPDWYKEPQTTHLRLVA